MASETSVEQCLDGAELANIVRSAISIELSNVRDTAMECSDDQAQAHGAEDGLDHLSKDEYIDFMRELEEELYSELRLQGTKRAAFMPHALIFWVLAPEHHTRKIFVFLELSLCRCVPQALPQSAR